MKKGFLALAGVLAFGLAACSPAGIDYDKAYLKGEAKIGNLPCVVDLYLKENNACLFDLTVNGKLPEGFPPLGEMLDFTGTYTVADNNYTFTVKVKDNKTQEEMEKVYTTTYADGKHNLEYTLYSDLGPKVFNLTGVLPL